MSSTLLAALLFLLFAGVTLDVESAPLEQQVCRGTYYDTVQPGDSWESLARTYATTAKVLKGMNQGTKFVVGATIKVPIPITCPKPAPPPIYQPEERVCRSWWCGYNPSKWR